MQHADEARVTMHGLNYILGLAAAASSLVCAPSPGGLQVATDRTSYRAGDPLTLTVHNGLADSIAFNPCTRTLEREEAGHWRAVSEPQRICTMEAWLLAPGERRAGPTDLPADLATGRYRAVLAFTVESANPSAGRREARTSPFAVRR